MSLQLPEEEKKYKKGKNKEHSVPSTEFCSLLLAAERGKSLSRKEASPWPSTLSCGRQIRMTHNILITHYYPIFLRRKLRLSAVSSFPSGRMSELASQFWFVGFFYHTTKVEALLFPELQKVRFPRVELAQEAKCVGAIKCSLSTLPPRVWSSTNKE